MIAQIAVAAPAYPTSLKEGLDQLERLAKEAAATGAIIVCFPESYLPGYPGEGFHPAVCTDEQLQEALQDVCNIARQVRIAIIVPMDWHTKAGLQNVAWVVGRDGQRLGYQTKNQLDPSEDEIWVPGEQRRIFEVEGLKFGIAICHEGFRYPESVRWAAREGAHVVFHPNLTGDDSGTTAPDGWGDRAMPYYEKAQMMRALENTIYFAPSNYTFDHPESASAIIAPDGKCIAYQDYGKAGVAVAAIDTDKATGLLARRFKSALYS